MTTQQVSPGRPILSRDRESIPILVFSLGLARSVLATIAGFVLVVVVAAVIAFVSFA
jgi:hypothetical protein